MDTSFQVQDLIVPWCSCGPMAFQFLKAEVSDLFDKQCRNEDFLDGIEESSVQIHTAPLWEVWQITILKSSSEVQGNHPREAASLPRESTDWFTASQLRKAFQKPLWSTFPTGMPVHSETLEQDFCIKLRSDACLVLQRALIELLVRLWGIRWQHRCWAIKIREYEVKMTGGWLLAGTRCSTSFHPWLLDSSPVGADTATC